MNNEDFRALVQKKSTKEIAREAVQEEFRKRKRRGNNKDDDYLSSDEDDAEKPNNIKKQHEFKRQRNEEKKRDDQDSNAKTTTKYRDRARERREGKNLDYQHDANLLKTVQNKSSSVLGTSDSQDAVRLSKYLGGDDEHTHLVKGLDVALAHRVKRELKGQLEEEDLDAIFQKAKQQPQQQDAPQKRILARDTKEAMEFLQQHVDSSSFTNSDVGRNMYEYLRKTYLTREPHVHVKVSGAGKALQRTTLLFSKHSHPHDRKRSWEIPTEHMHGKQQQDGIEGTTSAATPLSYNLIERIKAVTQQRQQEVTGNNAKQVDKESKQQQEVPDSKKNLEESDDDDDIFENVGEYVPTAATGSAEQNDKHEKSTTKVSVFSGLVHETTKTTSTTATQDDKVPKFLSRPNTAKGVWLSSYAGDYGEEMDFDFGGMHDQDDGKKGKKEDKKEKDEEED